jgi:DNA-binding MarR family transcriptional regulator
MAATEAGRVAAPAGLPAIEPEPAAAEHALGVAFRRVSRALNRLRGRDTHLAEGQLSHAQFELLIELAERGALPAGELAAAARLAPATVTQMLDALAESGHVERVRSDSDRRVVVSRLTPLGRRRIEAKRRAWQGRWQRALAGLSAAELQTATTVLGRLAEMLEEGPPPETCAQPRRAARPAVHRGRKPG